MQQHLQPLLTTVQRNCHIADARHAGNYTLCVYLLKMREYFRWEKGYGFDDRLSQADVGDWLKERECFWEAIEGEAFAELSVDGQSYDPFDGESLNAALNPYGLVYSGGLGKHSAPHFFLGKLGCRETQSGLTVFVAENEYARDLTAPPAMALDGAIFVRRESLRRMIWEKIEEWRWNRLDNAMGRTLASFDLDGDIETALVAMTDTLLDAVLLHEKGEVLAGKMLGPQWEQMLADLPHSKTEIMIRAVRDHLADALSTLPGLVANAEDAALHFYFANQANMQKHLFPSLTRAYESWVSQGRRSAIEALIPSSENHWSTLAGQVLEVYRAHPDDFAGRLQSLIEENKL
jgi:hypothetical protein